jgi:hypothetical protein
MVSSVNWEASDMQVMSSLYFIVFVGYKIIILYFWSFFRFLVSRCHESQVASLFDSSAVLL